MPIHKQHEMHGLHHIPEYGVWTAMIQRCCNSMHPDYSSYGGRGIKVCDRWRQSFKAFYEDMGPRPSAGYSIDRRDNDGNYCKSNCRWTTATVQNSNRRNTPQIDAKEEHFEGPLRDRHFYKRPATRSAKTYRFNGVHRTLSEWASLLNMNRNSLYYRIHTLGWPVEKALTTPQ